MARKLKAWRPSGPFLVARRGFNDGAVVAMRHKPEGDPDAESDWVWVRTLRHGERFETLGAAKKVARDIGGWAIPEHFSFSLDITG